VIRLLPLTPFVPDVQDSVRAMCKMLLKHLRCVRCTSAMNGIFVTYSSWTRYAEKETEILRRVGNCLPNDAAWHCRRLEFVWNFLLSHLMQNARGMVAEVL